MDENITKKKSFPKWAIAVGAVAVLAIATIIALSVSGVFSGNKDVEKDVKTPEIIGMNVEEAQALLEKSGLSLCITESKIDDTVEENTILTQSPEKGETLKSGSTVSVVVSEKSVTTEIPAVKYYDKTLAKDVLEQAGFEVQIKEIESDKEADGTVLSQSISGKGQTGSTVVITVIKNPVTETDKKVAVASVEGKTVEEAKTILSKSKLYLKVTYEQFDEKVEKGKIIYQSPKAKEKVNENSTVTVCVSRGKESDVKIIVPSVIYYTKSAAKTLLTSKGFIVTEKEEYNDKIPAGIVFSQSIEKGVGVKVGTVIALGISKGKNPASESSTTKAGFTGKLTTVTSGLTTKPASSSGSTAATQKPSSSVQQQTTVPVNQSAEKKYVADFRITTDKSTASVGDIIKVNVHLKTNYKIIAVSLPVIYDGDVFEMQGTSGSLASFLTFKGSLKSAGYSTNGNWKSPAQIYRKTSNPNYWEKDSTMDRWKVSFATWVALSSKSTQITTLNKEEVIVSFDLKVKNGASGSNGKILLNDDFLKTYENPAGILAVGRSLTNEVSAEFVSYGQTINLDNASVSVKIK